MRSTLWILAAALLSGLPGLCQAQNDLRPPLLLNAPGTSPFSSYETVSQTTVTGRAQKLELTYTASGALELLIAPFRTKDAYNPTDLLWVHLESGSGRTVTIDLSASPAWSPRSRTTFLWFLSPTGGLVGHVSRTEPIAGGIVSWPSIALRQFLQMEPFQVPTLHTLAGYRIFNIPVSALLSVLLLLCAAALMLARRRPTLQRSIVVSMVVMMLFLQVRVAVDLVRLTAIHLQTWFAEGTYAQTGAVAAVADTLRTEQERSPRISLFVYVCSTESDYYAKALRYTVYPIAITTNPTTRDRLTHVLVRYDRSLRDGGILTCGRFSGPARRVQNFRDGSALYSLLGSESPR